MKYNNASELFETNKKFFNDDINIKKIIESMMKMETK